MIEAAFDVYLLKAFQKNFINIDGKYIILTDSGTKELNDILLTTFRLVNESNSNKDFITAAVKKFRKETGQTMDDVEYYKALLQRIAGPTEARLLTFLMAEKEQDYKCLKKVITEQNEVVKPSLSVVKGNKQKYDA